MIVLILPLHHPSIILYQIPFLTINLARILLQFISIGKSINIAVSFLCHDVGICDESIVYHISGIYLGVRNVLTCKLR